MPRTFKFATLSSSRNFQLHSWSLIKGTFPSSMISNRHNKKKKKICGYFINCKKMSSSISSLRICNVPLPFSSSKGNGGHCSSLPISVKTPAKIKQVIAVAVAGNGRNAGETVNRDNLDHLQRLGSQPSQPKKRSAQPQNAVVLLDRFPAARTVRQMVDTMDRLMDDPYAYSTNNLVSVPTAEGNGYRRGRTPWAIKESETSFSIRYDMPGMNRNDVKVWVEENMLVLKAEKVPKKSEGGQAETVTHTDDDDEWPAASYGKYNNRIALPENVEFEKIKAEVKDGVLYITIPKAKATSKKIDISVH